MARLTKRQDTRSEKVVETLSLVLSAQISMRPDAGVGYPSALDTGARVMGSMGLRAYLVCLHLDAKSWISCPGQNLLLTPSFISVLSCKQLQIPLSRGFETHLFSGSNPPLLSPPSHSPSPRES